MVMLRTGKDKIMELWIRTQDRERLFKADHLFINKRNHICIDNGTDTYWVLGRYKTKKRALEILDEIQNKIKTLLYFKPKSLIKLEDLETAKSYFEKLNHVDFITATNEYEIEPITRNTIVYKMPKK